MAVRVLSRRTWIALGLLAVAGLSAAAASSYLLFWGKGPAVEPVRRTIVRTLERQTGLRISLGPLHPAPFGVLTLEGFVALDPTGRELASAERVAVHLSPWSWLVHRGRLSALVGEVELIRPRLRVTRRADGSWDWSGYLRPAQAGTAGWQGRVSFRDGELEVRGAQLPRIPALPERVRLTGLDGTVELGAGGRLDLQLSGAADLLPGAGFSLDGRLAAGNRGFLNFVLTGVDLVRAQRFVPSGFDFGRLSAGQGDFRGSLVFAPSGPRLVSAVADVRQAEWRHPSFGVPLSRLNGRFALRGEELRLTGLSFDFLDSRWTAQGTVSHLSDPTLDLEVAGENASLPDLARALPLAGRPALSGRASLDLTVRGRWREPLLSGFLRLGGVAVAFPGQPWSVADLRGTVEFAGDGLRTERLTARVAGGQVALAGEVRDWRKPHGSLSLRLDGVPVEELRRLAPPDLAGRLRPLTEGRLSGTLELEGNLAQPAVRGRLALLGARWGDLSVASALAEGTYAAGRLNLERVVLKSDAGRLEAAVTASLADPTRPVYTFSGELTGADLACLAQTAGWKLPVAVAGRGDLLVAGQGSGLSWEGLAASGTLTVTGGRVGDERFDSARAGFAVARGEVTVDYLNVSSPDGRLAGFGRRSAEGRLSGTLTGQGIRLSALTRYLQGVSLSGTADLLAEIGGTEQDPELLGEFTLFSPTFRRQSFAGGTGRFRLTRRLFALDQLSVEQGSGRLQASGTVGLGEGYPLALALEAAGLPARTILALAGVDADLTGTADGAFTVQGPARAAEIAGRAELKEGKVAGYPFRQASADFRYGGGALILNRFDAAADGMTLTGRGRLAGERLDFQLSADHLDLARLPLPGGTGAWRGAGSFRGTVEGTLRQPVLEGEVSGTGVAYRTYEVDAVAGPLRYQGGKIDLKGIRVERKAGRYFLTGQLDPKAAQLDLRLRIDRGELADLMDLASLRLRKPVSGDFTGMLHVWGGFRNPSARLLAESPSVRLSGLELGGDVDLALQGGEVTINRLRLAETGGEGVLVAVGRVSRTAVDVEARASRLDLAPLMALVGPQAAEITGRADAVLVAKGPAGDPRISLQGSVSGAKVNGVPIEHIAGRASYAGGAIHLAQVVLEDGTHRLTAAGTWPLPEDRLTRLGLHSKGEPWDLKVAMDRGDLGLFSFLLPDLRVSGPGSLTVQLAGPAAAPKVSGAVVAEGVTVSHPVLGGEISRINGRVELGPEGVTTRELTGVYNGGEVRLSGKVKLAGLAVRDLDLKLTGRNVHYRIPVFEAWIDADATVRGPLDEAVIAGRAYLNRSTLTLGAKTQPRRVTWDPKLDLTVSSREDMRVVTADRTIDARAYGTLTLRGRVSQPTFTGEAEASRGTIDYLDTPFRITRGQAVFSAYRGILPTLDVTAETVVPLKAPGSQPSAAAPPETAPGGETPSAPGNGNGSVPSTGLFRTRDLKITLTVTGPAENLALNLSSDPPLSQAEILAALALPEDISRIIGGDPQKGGGSQNELLRVAGQQLSNRLFSGMEIAVADALQLDQFSLTPGFQEKNIQLHLGKYLVDNVYLTYTRTLEFDPWESIGLEYRIQRGLTFTTSYDNRGEFQVGIEARHRF
ncbi:MAG TPA: hypothetical protein GXX28_01805 [Firmicutes bacterium]|nr:hypothetical protein [Bacillota bacterium]